MNKRFSSSLLALFVVLGVWRGYLAIYEEGREEPRQIFPNQVEALPQEDQDALNQGIIVRNDRDLQQLIEDYTS